MRERLPSWFKQKIPLPEKLSAMERLLERGRLNTICQSALCPNMGECFERRTATFLILGKVCTRRCTFCAVAKGHPEPVDEGEPASILDAVESLGLRYIVITSVTRDDLADGGASHFRKTVELLHGHGEGRRVEILIPDFGGSSAALQEVVEARPEVINHNTETVPRLYGTVRPGADYRRSLDLIRTVKGLDGTIVTKSGLMLGLGESADEVAATMKDLQQHGCDLLTLGQYLQPSEKHHPVARYLSPEEFTRYASMAEEMGFKAVAAAPLVRSSYMAAHLFAEAQKAHQVVNR
jgi:lipoyl synthase